MTSSDAGKEAQKSQPPDKSEQTSTGSGGGGFYNPKSPDGKDKDSSGGRFYKFRCENWNVDPIYCENWLFVNNAYCAMCLAKGLDKSNRR